MKRYCAAGLSVISLMALSTTAIWTTLPRSAQAHCQVPCGIYDDGARVTQLKEDAVTISKAIAQINELGAKHDVQAINQATRWIMTKENHASHIIEVVSEYFLTQKIKPVAKGVEGYDAYLAKLADHHAVMVAAMKTKQSASSESAAALDKAIDALARHYQ